MILKFASADEATYIKSPDSHMFLVHDNISYGMKQTSPHSLSNCTARSHWPQSSGRQGFLLHSNTYSTISSFVSWSLLCSPVTKASSSFKDWISFFNLKIIFKNMGISHCHDWTCARACINNSEKKQMAGSEVGNLSKSEMFSARWGWRKYARWCYRIVHYHS